MHLMRTPALVAAFLCALPSAVIAGGDYLGTWLPYSDVGSWFGAVTVLEDQIVYETGPRAGLLRIREGGSVFRLVDPDGEPFNDCGNALADHVGFRIMDNGMLAILHYRSVVAPPEPTGDNALEVIENDVCSVAFFTRQ